MANNPNERESYHEVPAKSYLFLFNTAIHKRFVLWWTIILWVSCYTLTRFIGLDYLILAWHIQNWWIAAPYTAIIAGSLWIWQREVTRDAKKREAEAAKKLSWAKTYIDKNLQEPSVKGEVNFKDE